MPRGTYIHAGGEAERFHCAPGPGGWRYVAEGAAGAVDLTVDSRWRQIRVQVTAGDWLVRGGVSGREVLWVRSPGPDPGGVGGVGGGAGATEHSAIAAGFLWPSPGFLVAIARSLGIAEGERTEVRLVELTGPALAALTVLRRWELAEVSVYDAELAPLPVQRYEVTDLATGERGSVHLAGDVVVDAPGIELVDLDGPPSGVVPG
jgi:hypothetical protein